MWTSSTTPTRGDDADSRWQRRLAVTTPTRGDDADSRWRRRLAVTAQTRGGQWKECGRRCDPKKNDQTKLIMRISVMKWCTRSAEYEREWGMNKWKSTEEMNDCKVMNIVIIKEQSTKKKTRTRGETLIDWLWFYFVILFCVDLFLFSLDYDVLSLDYDLLEYLFYSCCYSLSSELVLVQLFNVTCRHCWFL